MAGCIYFGANTACATTAQARLAPFASPEFWDAYPLLANSAKKAWQQGLHQPYGAENHAVYADGFIYGFSGKQLPGEQDHSVLARLKTAYAQRAEMQATQAAGGFAFNHFECSALADYEKIPANIDLCFSITPISSHVSSWGDFAFAIIQIPVASICGCVKAIDSNRNIDNTSSIYAAMVLYEINRLYEINEYENISSLFFKNYARRIFGVPELILIAESLAHTTKNEEASSILDAIVARFSETISSESMEKVGDIYHMLGNTEKAINAYEKAAAIMHTSSL